MVAERCRAVMVKQIQQQSFRPQIPELPVIGIAAENDADALPGLRSLRDEITRDNTSNAPYLVAVWDELVHAHQPIAICRTFTIDSKPVKVDVVAENGSRWIRVNTYVDPLAIRAASSSHHPVS